MKGAVIRTERQYCGNIMYRNLFRGMAESGNGLIGEEHAVVDLRDLRLPFIGYFEMMDGGGT